MSEARLIPSAGVSRGAGRSMSVVTAWLKVLLAKAKYGAITVVLPNGQSISARAAQAGPHAKLVIRRWRAIWRLRFGGDVEFAHAYIDGDWWTPDLLCVLNFGAQNADAFGLTTSGSWGARLVGQVRHWLSRNTRRGSRRNIAAHYDLGNAFYAPWLDRGMNYSSALFSDASQTLEAAQDAKLDRVVEMLRVSGGERVLEIGCGWGSLVERLASRCSITGITLSTEQLAYAQQRTRCADGTPNADLRLQDYRDATGQYDRIASIEMIEAVGEAYWPVYFAKIHELLTDRGSVVLQAITISEDRFASYRRQPDFIQQYVFPGGMLPTAAALRAGAARAGLKFQEHHSFGSSYARTLRLWRERFLEAWPRLCGLGFDEQFKRTWEYYLCYCEVGFRTGSLDVGLFNFSKANCLV